MPPSHWALSSPCSSAGWVELIPFPGSLLRTKGNTRTCLQGSGCLVDVLVTGFCLSRLKHWLEWWHRLDIRLEATERCFRAVQGLQTLGHLQTKDYGQGNTIEIQGFREKCKGKTFRKVHIFITPAEGWCITKIDLRKPWLFAPDCIVELFLCTKLVWKDWEQWLIFQYPNLKKGSQNIQRNRETVKGTK